MLHPCPRYEDQGHDTNHSYPTYDENASFLTQLAQIVASSHLLNRHTQPGDPRHDDATRVRDGRADVEAVEGDGTVPDLPPPPPYSPSWLAPRARRSATDAERSGNRGGIVCAETAAAIRVVECEEGECVPSKGDEAYEACSMTTTAPGANDSPVSERPRSDFADAAPSMAHGFVRREEYEALKKRLEEAEAWIASSKMAINPKFKNRNGRPALVKKGIETPKAAALPQPVHLSDGTRATGW